MRVWNFWLTLNEEKIIAEDDEHKIVRLNIIKEQKDGKKAVNSFLKYKNESLFDLYQDILYIETEAFYSGSCTWSLRFRIFFSEILFSQENSL